MVPSLRESSGLLKKIFFDDSEKPIYKLFVIISIKYTSISSYICITYNFIIPY